MSDLLKCLFLASLIGFASGCAGEPQPPTPTSGTAQEMDPASQGSDTKQEKQPSSGSDSR